MVFKKIILFFLMASVAYLNVVNYKYIQRNIELNKLIKRNKRKKRYRGGKGKSAPMKKSSSSGKSSSSDNKANDLAKKKKLEDEKKKKEEEERRKALAEKMRVEAEKRKAEEDERRREDAVKKQEESLKELETVKGDLMKIKGELESNKEEMNIRFFNNNVSELKKNKERLGSIFAVLASVSKTFEELKIPDGNKANDGKDEAYKIHEDSYSKLMLKAQSQYCKLERERLEITGQVKSTTKKLNEIVDLQKFYHDLLNHDKPWLQRKLSLSKPPPCGNENVAPVPENSGN